MKKMSHTIFKDGHTGKKFQQQRLLFPFLERQRVWNFA